MEQNNSTLNSSPPASLKSPRPGSHPRSLRDVGRPARPTSINKATVEEFNRISRRMSIAESE